MLEIQNVWHEYLIILDIRKSNFEVEISPLHQTDGMGSPGVI